ncbi:C25 family cysteine peptidase [Streptomyces sp. NPDC001920]
MSATKLIIANYSAMQNKGYGEADLTSVQEALTRLVKSDQDRGITTTVVDLSNRVQMAQYDAPVVTDEKDEKQNKDAIDAVFRSAEPDYLMLLGSHDVIPHQHLTNLASDDDPSVPSDLPYACEVTYDAAGQEPSKFTNPSRVVGRLPDVTGSHDPSYLVHLIKYSAAATSVQREAYQSYFGLSAAVWRKSTEVNLTDIFGNANALHLIPPDGSPWLAKSLAARSHFVNCHGASRDPNWYGEGNGGFPVALKANDVNQPLTSGTILAAECCYGAELYQPSIPTGMPICNTYLDNGAVLFFGSTNIAYGPADHCDKADLISRYVIRETLQGQSSGYATLKARLDYVKGKTHLDPVDLKTLSQFILLGDPSVRPVGLPKLATEETDAHAAMAERRHEAKRTAHVLQQGISVPQPVPSSYRSAALEEQLHSITARHGLPPSASISSFAATWRSEAAVPKGLGRPPRQHLLHAVRSSDAPVRTDIIVIVREQDDRIVSVEEYEAR